MNHKKYIKRAVKLSEEALKEGDNPFGAVIADKEGVLTEAKNKTTGDVTGHAEIIAMKKAQKILNTNDLSNYTIYSSCEPCPMCAFMIRELKFKRVVFSLASPFMGGYSKWNILEDEELMKFEPVFSDPPEIIFGILKEEASEVFKKAGWTIDS